MKVIIFLLTVFACIMLVWEICHFPFASYNKSEKVVPAEVREEKHLANNSGVAGKWRWRQYTFLRKAGSPDNYETIISSYPKPDTLNMVNKEPSKQLGVFTDTLAGQRICIFRPTSQDGKYGEWIILADSIKFIKRFISVKMDSSIITGNKKIFLFKKEKGNVILRDTITLQ